MNEAELSRVEELIADRRARFHTVYGSSGSEYLVRCRTSVPQLTCVTDGEWARVLVDERYFDYLWVISDTLLRCVDERRLKALRKDSLYVLRAELLILIAELKLNLDDDDISCALGIIHADSPYLRGARDKVRRSMTGGNRLAPAGESGFSLSAGAFPLQHEISHLLFRFGEKPRREMVGYAAASIMILERTHGAEGRPPGAVKEILAQRDNLKGKEHWWEEIWADFAAIDQLAQEQIEAAKGRREVARKRLAWLHKTSLISIMAGWLMSIAHAIPVGLPIPHDFDERVADTYNFATFRIDLLANAYKLLYSELIAGLPVPEGEEISVTDAWEELREDHINLLVTGHDLIETLSFDTLGLVLELFKQQGQLRRLLDGLLEEDDTQVSLGIELGWFDRDC